MPDQPAIEKWLQIQNWLREEAKKEWLRQHELEYVCSTGKTVTAIFGGALRSNAPGVVSFRGVDSAGRTLHGKYEYEDAQATEPEFVGAARCDAIEGEATAPRDCTKIASDENAQTEDRVAALREWMTTDLQFASEFILNELGKSDLPEDWRHTLVFAAENAHFVTSDQQREACSRLRELARGLRHGRKAGTEHVVWSAMRRFASLLPPEEVGSLLEFLDREGSVDTRMVALQCVARLFEGAPPADTASVEPLANRVAELAEKFLDPDVFSSGENSGIARWAVVALAALGSPRLKYGLEHVKSLDKSWFSARVSQELRGLLNGWRDAGVSESDATVRLVQESLRTIE
ncbi:MAG: hypothetical protein NTW96_00825 [Planctomycetia bacterium]|nr:hypothetical protein [Planctomycetia bacterium]